jgi:hypothetical protein
VNRRQSNNEPAARSNIEPTEKQHSNHHQTGSEAKAEQQRTSSKQICNPAAKLQ